MRYLTKLSDQLLVFIDEAVEDALVFESVKEESDNDASDEDADDVDDAASGSEDDGEGVDRMYKFNVAKTHEQSEDVITAPGFTVST